MIPRFMCLFLRHLRLCTDSEVIQRAGAVDQEIKNNVSSIKWHSDMSYEM
jgi:hypothetical protein